LSITVTDGEVDPALATKILRKRCSGQPLDTLRLEMDKAGHNAISTAFQSLVKGNTPREVHTYNWSIIAMYI
ncbi:hypothetical protein KIPB_014638, partial [Kipferlia bialata]